ncbi:MAG: efflux RND transporter periplasmic adaptor subunit, partial [Coriobacteriales bacterium]|nr:efflux RND transporter periplasmic adaptor subunit [Coriobacteriales bacterium]
MNVPSVEDADVNDNTVASAALGYGLKRNNYLEQDSPARDARQATDNGYAPERLSRDEVAAVREDRAYYVSDVPSPYLSSRQAQEDVRDTKRRHNTMVTILTLCFVIAVLGASGWFLWNSMKARSIGDVTQYSTAYIEKGEFLETTSTTSIIRPIAESTIASEISGTIAEIMVQDGAGVNAGDVLFRLDNSSISESYNRARETRDSAQNDVNNKQRALDEAKSATAIAQSNLEKAQAAMNTGSQNGTTTENENGTKTSTNEAAAAYAQAQSALTAAQSRETTAQVQLDAANVTLQTVTEAFDRAQEQQDRLLVRTPIAGTVGSLNGDLMVATPIASGTRLCVVSDLSRYCVQVEIPADKRNRISEGQEVRLTFPDIPDFTVTSSISSFEDSDNMHLANVYIEANDERLVSGLAVQATVILQSIPDSLIVPIETVRVAKDGTTHLDVLLDPSRGIKT